MLYKKNSAPSLPLELFQNPTAEYRGAPFWSWNCKLEKRQLLRQLEQMKEMGFGGAHLHPRTGLDTAYLSDEFMDMVKACCDKAEAEEMLTWLYDEDRWPSGAAGGIVTKDPQYRARYLLLTARPYNSGAEDTRALTSSAGAKRTENGYLLACYDEIGRAHV